MRISKWIVVFVLVIAGMALRSVAAGMIEANKGFRRLMRISNCRFCVRPFKFTTNA